MTVTKVSRHRPGVPGGGGKIASGGDAPVWRDQTQLVAFPMNLSKPLGQMNFVILALSNQEIKGTVGPQAKQHSLGSF